MISLTQTGLGVCYRADLVLRLRSTVMSRTLHVSAQIYEYNRTSCLEYVVKHPAFQDTVEGDLEDAH